VEVQAIVDKISNELSLEPDQLIDSDTELLMSGIIDSLGVVSLIAWLETEIDTAIDPGLVTLENFERPTAIHALCQQVVAGS